MGRHSAVAAFMVVAVAVTANPVRAQHVNDLLSIFGGDRRAARQAQAEWRRLPPAETNCIDQRLRRKGSSVEALIRRGVKPSAARLVELRSSCRDFVQSLQTDAAPWSARESPTSDVAANNPTEPKTPDETSSAQSAEESGMTTAEPPKDFSVTSWPESPKESRVTLLSEQAAGPIAAEHFQQDNHEQDNSVLGRGIMGWLAAAFVFALVAIAALLGIVKSLFIRWRNIGQRAAAVSVAEKKSEEAGDTPLNIAVAEQGKVVTGEGQATLMSQDSANISDTGPCYGDIFPGIAATEVSASNSPSSVENVAQLAELYAKGAPSEKDLQRIKDAIPKSVQEPN